jgi:4-amino-4-deoxy-L-arabinose transferase-like glycosyltransferase
VTLATGSLSSPAAAGEERRARRDDWLFGALLFVVALAPRVAVGLASAAEPVWDGHYYDFAARRIAEGHGYSDDLTIAGQIVWHPWCHYPVGYSAFLAAFYRLFGHGHAVAVAANALVGAALAVATWALASKAMSPFRARAAGLVVALHPGLILYAALTMTEPLAALLTMSAFVLAVGCADRRDRAHLGLALGALALGVAALVRPQALLCVPFLGLLLDGPWFRRAVGAAVACAIALTPVLPWTVRNCRVMDSCALISTNGGWNLAIGAFPRATGRFETLRSSDGCREVTGQVQQDRCWFAYGVDQIRARPWWWLSLVPAKLGYTFDHESFAVEYLHEALPDAWPEPRRVAVRDLTTAAHRLLLAASCLGCIAFPVITRRGRGAVAQGLLLLVVGALGWFALAADRPSFWPMAVFLAVLPWLRIPGQPPFPIALKLSASLLATTIVTHAVFFGEDRYHMVVVPVLALFAAHALVPPERASRTRTA